ncbi:hypothetical protein [Reichenbachiella versicolor]|uniref:hypothetical protein n=1 Tax=Reichenbachiella versicolor TaxID=1821036 RepID=UPI000D6E6C48|nr:hypothetical protein [Reichenbachiella versicolor]
MSIISSIIGIEYIKEIDDHLLQEILNAPESISELIDTFLSSDNRVSQRCAHLLSKVCDFSPDYISSYVPRLINVLEQHPSTGVKRNILRIIQFQQVPQRYQGDLVNHCFHYLSSQEPIAIKVFSMTIIANHCKEHPELAVELRMVINDLMEKNSSAGIQSRGRKTLKQIDQMNASI